MYEQTHLGPVHILRHQNQHLAQTRVVVVICAFSIIFVIDVVFVLSMFCLPSLESWEAVKNTLGGGAQILFTPLNPSATVKTIPNFLEQNYVPPP